MNIKGIPCFEYSEVGPKGQNRIDYRFVTGDEEIVSNFRVSLGDTDPMSGEKITDLTLFQEYRRMRNQEVYGNKKAIAMPLSAREKEVRRELQVRISAEFKQEFGYEPDNGTLKWLLNEAAPRKYRLEIDSFVTEEGISWADCMAAFADSSAEEDFLEVENDGMDPIEAFAATLDEKELEMFRLLQMKADGCNMHGMICYLARKWGMEQYQVTRMKQRIGRKLKAFLMEQACMD